MAKRKKPARPARQREYSILFTVAENVVSTGVQIGPGGVVRLLGADGAQIKLASAAVEQSYDRPKGRKVLLRGPVDTEAPSIDPHAHLQAYDALLGIDTNTETIGSDLVSVGVVCVLIRKKTTNGSTLYESVPKGATEFRNARGDPERLSWRTLCEALVEDPDYPRVRIGIIVDSSLDSLAAINARTEPVYDDWYLPDRITLIFASDSAAASVANKVIQDCDRQATEILRMIAAGRTKTPLVPAPSGAAYSHARSWVWNAPSG